MVSPSSTGSTAHGILDNRTRGKVGSFLAEHIKPHAELAIVSAYFTIHAYAKLAAQLDSIKHLRFLFGEPRFIRSIDPDKTASRAYDIEDGTLRLANRLKQKQAAQACAAWLAAKADIRSVKRPGFLHGKLYHITQENSWQDAIVGSSNFTVSGLGLNDDRANVELNLVVQDRRDLADLINWFNGLWDDAELVQDVKAEVLEYLAQVYRDQAPEFIYYKTLFHLFQVDRANQAPNPLDAVQRQVVDSAIWQALFEFQREGVKAAINKLNAYNGCILADSVGLGKTYTALAVIKHFELRNARVLVLCPKKLRDNWTVYQAQNNHALNPFVRDRFGYTVLSHTDLSRTTGRVGDVDLSNFQWGNYDLVVIDESHNFRNNARGDSDRPSRYARLMQEVIQSGVKTKVLLLSATPVNTTLRDLRNQLYLITGNDDAALRNSLGIASLNSTLNSAQRQFMAWASAQEPRSTQKLLESLPVAFFTLLDALTIARSRQHLRRHYPDVVNALGGFPNRRPPENYYPAIDAHGQLTSYEHIGHEIEQYRLALFKPSHYILPEFRKRYETSAVPGFEQAVRENYLIKMMKANFLKRLESSVHSFRLTLERTVARMDALLERIDRFERVRNATLELDWDDVSADDLEDDDLREAFDDFKVSHGKIALAHLDVSAWKKDLLQDRQTLHGLLEQVRVIDRARDAKLAVLRTLIANKARQPTQNRDGELNRKTLIFTAFADTAAYLYDALAEWARQDLGVHVALVTGSQANRTTFGQAEFNHILTHFAPRAKRRAQQPSLPQEAEIDVLIATDCISEGQNLQDCDYLVNYDIHWNPVRVIQRFGRIDRIGSRNSAVQMVNFWPTQDLDSLLKLIRRVETRMTLVDMTATQEDNPLQATNEAAADGTATDEAVNDALNYRDQQVRRLRTEVLDLEDLDGSVSLTDFTLDDFRADLSRYLEANRAILEAAPMGLYAVTATNPAVPLAQPGVIFCLRHKPAASSTTTVNPLQPYYLAYVLDDGTVRLTFVHPKQILELLRQHTVGRVEPDEALYRQFEAATQHGADMSRYDHLLNQALAASEKAFQQRVAATLQSSRHARLPTLSEHVTASSDFELVTWLVLR